MWLYPEVRTLGESITYHARNTPQKIALRDSDTKVTFELFDRITNQIAHAITSLDLGNGDRVGFLDQNSVDFFFALIGVAKTRASFVPLNWRLAPSELADIIDDGTLKLVFVGRDFENIWASALNSAKSDPLAVWLSDSETISGWSSTYSPSDPVLPISEEDCAIQIYTSGTTGRPKGVMLSHGGFNRMRLCDSLEKSFQFQDDDVFLNSLPNFHLLSIGISLQCLYFGVAVSIVRQFTPSSVVVAVSAFKPTILVLTPTMLQMVLDEASEAKVDLSQIRLLFYAGSAISAGLLNRALSSMKCSFVQFYGTTESGGPMSILGPEEHGMADPGALQSCGRPLPLMAFRIVDDEGEVVADGTAGELLVRTPAVMLGYWNMPEETSQTIENGWFRTGDVAQRNQDGLYQIVDRKKDMIVSGGENIYSTEVENVLSLHPDVGSVAVIGVPDPKWGEAVKAVVVRAGQSDIDGSALIQWCRERLAAYKIPKSIDFVSVLPQIASGKVSKKALRAQYWHGTDRGVG